MLTPYQNLAVDLLILSFDRQPHTVKIFTPKRNDDHKKALPGVLLTKGESIDQAVARTLRTKTNLSDFAYRLQELPAQTRPDRDPRGHVVSIPIIVFLTEPVGYSDGWSPLEKNLDLAFDHTEMVDKAIAVLTNNLQNHPLPLLLAGDTITLEEARDLLAQFSSAYQTVLPSNLRQLPLVKTFLQQTDTFAENNKGKQGRRPRLYAIATDRIAPLYQ